MTDAARLVTLRQELERRFNDEELRTFCQNLGVEYDDLPGQGRANKARELVAYMDRRGQLDELEQKLKEYEPPIPRDKHPFYQQLWLRYLIVMLVPLVGFVADIGSLLGLTRCVQLGGLSAFSGLVGVGLVVFWTLPRHKSRYTKQDRALTGLLTLLITALFAALAITCSKGNRCPEVSLSITPKLLVPGEAARLTAHALDPDGDPLTYYWEASRAGLEKSGGPYLSPQNSFIALADLWGQKVTVSVKVDDGKCKTMAVAQSQIVMAMPSGTPAVTPTPTATSTDTPIPTPSPDGTLTPTPSTTQTPSPTASPSNTPPPLIVIHSGPSGQYFRDIGTVASGPVAALAKYTNRDGERWYLIDHNGQAGWLPDTLVQPIIRPSQLPPHCFYVGQQDKDSFRLLIDAETKATIEENIGIIFVIFGRDAEIYDGQLDKTWANVIDRYRAKFASEQFYAITHADFTFATPTPGAAAANQGIGAVVMVTTSSKGDGDWGQGRQTFSNPPGSDRWTFTQDANGCWVIDKLEYNLHLRKR